MNSWDFRNHIQRDIQLKINNKIHLFDSNVLLLPHNNEYDGYTTTEDVVQYAAVQKKSAKDNQVSNDNV